MLMGFSFVEEVMQKCFSVYINRSHLLRERHRVSWGIVSHGGSCQANGLGT
jgi:hypothetical protein